MVNEQKMTLKNARLGRAEYLPANIRQQFNLPEKGVVIIESRIVPELRENIVPMPAGGIREYLLSFGKFQEDEMPNDE